MENGQQRVRLALKTFDALIANTAQIDRHFNYLKERMILTARKLWKLGKRTSENETLDSRVRNINTQMMMKFETIMTKYRSYLH